MNIAAHHAVLADLVRSVSVSESKVDLTPSTHLLRTGILDSLGVLELASVIERSYRIKLPASAVKPSNFSSIEKIGAMLERFAEGGTVSDIVDFEPGYLKTATDFPFLRELERNLDAVRGAYHFILENDLFQQMPGVAEKRAVQRDSWFLFPIYINCNHDFYLDFLSYKVGVDVRSVLKILRENLPVLFTALDRVLLEAPVISVTFMRMRPGTTLKVHADSGAFQYRSHMGVIVPRGNCALRVKDTVAKWKEGAFLVFDATQPHLAWNLTQEDRVVLSIDLFKDPVYESRIEHLAEVKRKMELSPLGFDGGGYLPLDEQVVRNFNRIVEVVDY